MKEDQEDWQRRMARERARKLYIGRIVPKKMQPNFMCENFINKTQRRRKMMMMMTTAVHEKAPSKLNLRILILFGYPNRWQQQRVNGLISFQ